MIHSIGGVKLDRPSFNFTPRHRWRYDVNLQQTPFNTCGDLLPGIASPGVSSESVRFLRGCVRVCLLFYLLLRFFLLPGVKVYSERNGGEGFGLCGRERKRKRKKLKKKKRDYFCE